MENDIKQAYLNQLKDFAFNDSKYEEDDIIDGYIRDNFIFAFIFTTFLQLHSEIFADINQIANFDCDDAINFFSKIEGPRLNDIELYKDNNDFRSIVNYSLLKDMIALVPIISFYTNYIDKIIDEVHKEDQTEDEYNESIDKMAQEVFLNAYRDFLINTDYEFFKNKGHYKASDYLIRFIDENKLSNDVAQALEEYSFFKDKFLFDSSLYDDDYTKETESLFDKLTSYGFNVNFMAFTDMFISQKYKGLLDRYADKFLKTYKTYNIVKMVSSIARVENVGLNIFGMSLIALDFIKQQSKNKDLEKIKVKNFILDNQDNVLLDIETNLFGMLEPYYAHISKDDFRDETFMHDNHNFTQMLMVLSSYLSNRRIIIEISKYYHLLPLKLSLQKLKFLTKDNENLLSLILPCYEIHDSDDITIKSSLSMTTIKNCYYTIERIGYFTLTGLAKGLIAKI